MTAGSRRARAIASCLVLAACSGTGPPPPAGSRLQMVQTIPGTAFRLSVDGRLVDANFSFGVVTPAILLLPGQHDLVGQPLSDTSSFAWVLDAADSVNCLVFVTDTTGSSGRVIILGEARDTGGGPPAGQAELRAADFSTLAGLAAHFADAAGDTVGVSSFYFRAVSGFYALAPGDWTLVVSHSGRTDTVYLGGPVSLVAGQARTVVVLDSLSSSLTSRVVPDRN